jgi:hypothetical protein
LTAAWLSATGSTTAAAPLLLSASYVGPKPAVRVPRSFLGLSTDWPALFFTISGIASGPDPLYDRLIAKLAAFGGGPPNLRVGGHYQDHSWWNPHLVTPSHDLGLAFDIVPALLRRLAASVRATGQHLILGINMGTGKVSVAVDEVHAMQSLLPRHYVLAYDIGNEPEGYGVRVRSSKTVNNRPVYKMMRPRSWNTPAIQRLYDRDFARYASPIEKLRPRPPLSGCSCYGNPIFPQVFLRSDRKYMRVYTQHSYVGTACNPKGVPWPPGNPNRPTVASLLGNPGEFNTLAQDYRGAKYAHAYGLPFEITEWQSYACGGAAGISDSLASALWGLNKFFLEAASGVDGIQIHLNSTAYAPFSMYTLSDFKTRAAVIGGLYYGMLLFAEATGHHASIVFGLTGRKRPKNAQLRLWTTRDGTRTLRFVAIDKDLHRSGRFQIHVPHAHGPATLIRLTGPSAKSRTIFLAGQTFASPTYDGKLTGNRVVEVVRPRKGTYMFTLSKTSAAMLTVPRSSY